LQWVRFYVCLAVDNASSTEWFPIDVSCSSRPTVKRFCERPETCVPATYARSRSGDDVRAAAREERLSAFHEIAGVEPTVRPRFPVANVRVMVPNVDQCWSLANELGAPIILPIADRYYGLRDFIISDPDGFGVRFASQLARR